MIVRQISRTILEKKPYEAWNAFINILACEKIEDLDDVQRVPHLCFWYDSEVQNGGHLQYFENQGTLRLQETAAALTTLGAECQRNVLANAGDIFLSKSKDRIKTLEDYVTIALRDELGAYDSSYNACKPPIEELLKGYFEGHRDHFIEIV